MKAKRKSQLPSVGESSVGCAASPCGIDRTCPVWSRSAATSSKINQAKNMCENATGCAWLGMEEPNQRLVKQNMVI